MMSGYSENKSISPPICSFCDENNIELHHVFETLKKKRRICLSIISIFAVVSVILSFTLPKEYLVQSNLFPPYQSDILGLLIPNYNPQDTSKWLYGSSEETIYSEFVSNLYSTELHYQFFKENNLIEKYKLRYNKEITDETIIDNVFSKKMNISFKKGPAGDKKFLTVELFGDDPDMIADLLNKYIHFADAKTISFNKEALTSKIFIEKNSIQEKIFSLRKAGEEKRKNDLNQIGEDLKIAENLNIIDPANVSFNYYSQRISNDTGVAENIFNTPGYFKGVNILKAELNSLKNRKNNDPFIPGILKLIEEREYLNKVSNVTFDGIHAARIDKVATPPGKAIKPMKVLIVGLGIVFGVLIAIFIVLIDIIIDKRFKNHPHDV